MLNVIFIILRVIGLILLILIGVILLLLLLVLFVPIMYRAEASKYPPGEPEREPGFDASEETEEAVPDILKGLKASIKAHWLLGLLRVRFAYPDPGTFVVKILFFNLYDSGKPDKPSAKTRSKNQKEKTESDVDMPEDLSEDLPEEPPKEPPKEPLPGTVSEASSETASESISYGDTVGMTEETKRNSSPIAKLKDKVEKIQYTIHDTCDKIKNVWGDFAFYKELWEERSTQELLKHVFSRLRKVLKSIRPRKLKANLCFGTGSPDTTGYMFGVYGALCPHLGKKVFVTPDFQQAILEGEVLVAGHITVAQILWQALMIAIDKKLWRLISKIKKKDT